MGDHIIRYFPQVTWDLPLAAAGNFDAITGCEKGARLSLVPPLLRTIKLGWR
jgi:hypothetical protein